MTRTCNYYYCCEMVFHLVIHSINAKLISKNFNSSMSDWKALSNIEKLTWKVTFPLAISKIFQKMRHVSSIKSPQFCPIIFWRQCSKSLYQSNASFQLSLSIAQLFHEMSRIQLLFCCLIPSIILTHVLFSLFVSMSRSGSVYAIFIRSIFFTIIFIFHNK